MLRTRLAAPIAGALVTLVFAAGALAAGGGATPGDDNLHGGAHADRILAGAGDDHVSGGGGADDLNGGSGSDVLRGGAGDDRMRGGAGDDDVNGQTGDDRLTDHNGADRLRGGSGDDRIDSRDASGEDHPDRVDCGPGQDIALVDSDDTVVNCEHVLRDDHGTDAPGTDDNGAAHG